MLTYIEEKSHLSSPALIPGRYLCCKKYLKNPADGIFHIVWHFCCFFLLSDIAGTSVEQCEVRYREMMGRGHQDRQSGGMFTAEFITADCTKVWQTKQREEFSKRIWDV